MKNYNISKIIIKTKYHHILNIGIKYFVWLDNVTNVACKLL